MNELKSASFVDEHELALALARNALGMKLPITELLTQLGIDPNSMLALANNQSFKDMVKSYRAELEKDGEGIRLKSAVALEHSIPKLYALVHNDDTPANVVVQGIKQMADMAAINKQDTIMPTGSGFVVNINLSGLDKLALKAPKPQVIIDAPAE